MSDVFAWLLEHPERWNPTNVSAYLIYVRSTRGLSAEFARTALVIAASVAYTVFSGQRSGGLSQPEYVEDWEVALSASIPYHVPDAEEVSVLVLTDHECPACRGFHPILKTLIAERGNRVGVHLVEYPLPYHRFAKPAARAVECAFSAGEAPRLIDLLFEKQDSLGLKSWGAFAEEAGIVDTAAIARCATESSETALMAMGTRLASMIDERGVPTPTVLVHGWRYSTVPSEEELFRGVDAVLSDRRPRVGPR